MNKSLNSYAKNKYSQFGEDGIIERVFEVLPKQKEYWCVEFGAWDGKYLSNTYELIANQNWKGVLIEGNPTKFIDLELTYANNKNAILVKRMVSFEGANTLDRIFEETSIPLDFDLLSIDIDGSDYHVWDSLKKYRPKVVVIEFNQTIPGDIEFIQERDFTLNHGSSLLSTCKLAKEKGYELVAATNNNGIFVKQEYFAAFGIENNSIAALWEKAPSPPRIFQLYDGTLVVTEKFKLIWHDKYVGKMDLQALPKPLRFFGDAPNMAGSYKKLLRKIYYRFVPAKNLRKAE